MGAWRGGRGAGGGGQREVEWGGRGSLAYVGQAEESILQVCQLTEVKETSTQTISGTSVRPFYRKTLD